MSGAMKEHWENVYGSKEIKKLGWYEEVSAPSIRLISKCGIGQDEAVLDVGAGASTLIDHLIDEGYRNVIAVDISEAALRKLSERLGEERSRRVKFIADDITEPRHIESLGEVALWHDRALLHFLLEEKERSAYLAALKKLVRKGGHVIIAAFSLKGAKRCSGLNVVNYDHRMLSDFLGEGFRLVEHFDHTYYTPSGEERPYVYTLFERTSK